MSSSCRWTRCLPCGWCVDLHVHIPHPTRERITQMMDQTVRDTRHTIGTPIAESGASR